jgi:hypothetical protein
VRYVTDPNFGIPAKSQWLPTVAEVKAACEGEMRPRYEQLHKIRQAEEDKRSLPAPESTEEERARAVKRWEDMRDAGKVNLKLTEAEMEERIKKELARPITLGLELQNKIAALAAQIAAEGDNTQ